MEQMHMRPNSERAGIVAGAIAAAVLAALTVTTSGRAAGDTGGQTTQSPASDASYNAAFDKSTHDSCLKAATSHGAASDTADRYCNCVVSELDKLTAQQEDLTPSSPELQSAQTTCKAQLAH
jgi:hypothetical protein